jgi:Anti-sigma-K factor rskA/Sigma-70, region 4
MASYDQLSAQQRAIVDLILKRGQSYDQLAETLDMPEARVRQLAGEALTSLAPVSAGAVDEDWRGQIADYLLGQQDPPDAASTRGHLRRSESARAWSRSVLDSLEHLYPKGELPTIPSGDNGAEPRAAKPARERKPAAPRIPLSPEAAAIVRRRRIGGIAAAAVALLFILLVWPVGLLTGGDDSDDGGDRASTPRAELVGQVLLRAVPGSGANRDRHAGVAIVTEQGDKLELGIEARLPPTKQNQAYEVWLYSSPTDAVSLGAQITDRQGAFAGRADLPEDYKSYRYLDVSRETVDENAGHSGTSMLRAPTAAIRPPQGNAGQGSGAATTP